MTDRNIIDLETKAQVLAHIKKCRAVLIMPRFGCVTDEVEITKAEARRFFAPMSDDATPAEYELSTGRFGFYRVDTKDLFLG